MRRLLGLTLAASLLIVGTSTRADEQVRIKGSDTIGGRMMPEIAEAYQKNHSSIQLVVEALGSGTAFVGLFDGSADIGEASRPINEKELATAKALGMSLNEIVIGYDGVSVIVNPGNPVKELTVAQLSDVFTGKVSNWKAVGGKDLAIRVISRPSYSGTHAFFKEKAVRRGDAKGPEEFSPKAEYMEENGEIMTAVASDPAAVSYVGLGWLNATVKAVPIVGHPGEPAVAPSADSVRTGRYPLYRALYMYLPAKPKPAAADFVRFVLSDEARALVTGNGFIPVEANAPLPGFLAQAAPLESEAPRVASQEALGGTSGGGQPAIPNQAAEAPAAGAAPAAEANVAAAPAARPSREVVRFNFAFGATTLTPQASATLDEVARKLLAGGYRATITGHADSKGPAEVNTRIALVRAKVVAQKLMERGVPASLLDVQGAGADAPVASNESVAGRAQNRRADIELLPSQ